MESERLVAARPPPDLRIPESKHTVSVSCIDSTGRVRLPSDKFLQPEYVGNPNMQGPSLSFLIEHSSNKPVIFDLAIQKDLEALPIYRRFAEQGWYVHVEKDVATILRENGVDVDGGAVGAIIWSHHHWDHVGDPSTFPKSTEVVVGPGFKNAHLPGYPTNPDASLLERYWEGRQLREIDFTSPTLRIGRFAAHDYFGDGSFYLLDTPGHSVGHICGLARVSADPATFVFMGGDAAHHASEFRPSEFVPIPKELDPSPLKRRGPTCPGHLLEAIHPERAANKRFYHVTEHFAHDKALCDGTLEGLSEFDAHENILTLVAHDDTVVDPPQLDLYPKSLNDWYKHGVKSKLRWRFFGDFEAAVEAKERGEDAFKWGKYP